MTLHQHIAYIDQFLNRLRRLTAAATGGTWVKLHQDAGHIQREILPIIEAAIPDEQPALFDDQEPDRSRRDEIARAVDALPRRPGEDQ